MTTAVISCAAAMPGDDALDAFERLPATARSDTARSVPRMCAVSGITLFVVPARIFVIVITTGSNVLIRRVTNVCSACTISAATGIGSLREVRRATRDRPCR